GYVRGRGGEFVAIGTVGTQPGGEGPVHGGRGAANLQVAVLRIPTHYGQALRAQPAGRGGGFSCGGGEPAGVLGRGEEVAETGGAGRVDRAGQGGQAGRVPVLQGHEEGTPGRSGWPGGHWAASGRVNSIDHRALSGRRRGRRRTAEGRLRHGQ